MQWIIIVPWRIVIFRPRKKWAVDPRHAITLGWRPYVCFVLERPRAMREIGMSARYLGSNRLGGGNPRDCQSQT